MARYLPQTVECLAVTRHLCGDGGLAEQFKNNKAGSPTKSTPVVRILGVSAAGALSAG